MLGGGNDRLYGVLCNRLGKPEWIKDSRFATNADRVKHRNELEELIEEVTRTKTTKEWLEVLEGSGMPYSAINDVQTTLQHEHGELSVCDLLEALELTLCSPGAEHGYGGRPSVLRSNEAREPASQVLRSQTQHTKSTTYVGPEHK